MRRVGRRHFYLRGRRGGFSLIELLVVIAVIVLLLAILSPSVSRVIDLAQNVICKSNMQRVGTAFCNFAADHDLVLPGGIQAKWQGPEPWAKWWVGSEIGWGSTPGTLTPYLSAEGGETVKVYRCPGLEEGVRYSGVGSNGMIDYAYPLGFSGAKILSIPHDAIVMDPDTGLEIDTLTPIIVEEDPMYWLNRNLEPSHANMDRIGTWHDGGSNMIANDGSVHRVKFTGRGANTYEWKIVTPSGATANLHHSGYG